MRYLIILLFLAGCQKKESVQPTVKTSKEFILNYNPNFETHLNIDGNNSIVQSGGLGQVKITLDKGQGTHCEIWSGNIGSQMTYFVQSITLVDGSTIVARDNGAKICIIDYTYQ